MKKSFVNLDRVMLTAVIRESNKRAAIAAMINAQNQGAMGFDLHVNCLEPQYRNVNDLSEIFGRFKRPVLALNYNNDMWFRSAGLSQEEMLSGLEMAVDAGAAAVDLQGFMFDTDTKKSLRESKENYPFIEAMPAEVTLNPEAIEKQKEWIKKIHDKGGEVVLSTHTGCYLSGEQLLSLALKLEERGADLLKIVTTGCNTEQDVADAAQNVVMLKKHLKTKFQYHCNGKCGQLTRIINPMLGSYLIFTIADYKDTSAYEQINLSKMVDLFNYLDM